MVRLPGLGSLIDSGSHQPLHPSTAAAAGSWQLVTARRFWLCMHHKYFPPHSVGLPTRGPLSQSILGRRWPVVASWHACAHHILIKAARGLSATHSAGSACVSSFLNQQVTLRVRRRGASTAVPSPPSSPPTWDLPKGSLHGRVLLDATATSTYRTSALLNLPICELIQCLDHMICKCIHPACFARLQNPCSLPQQTGSWISGPVIGRGAALSRRISLVAASHGQGTSPSFTLSTGSDGALSELPFPFFHLCRRHTSTLMTGPRGPRCPPIIAKIVPAGR